MTGNALTIGAAFLLGLVASGHCIVMCGGITAALGIATAKRPDGRPRRTLLFGYQLGRVMSYTLAGLLFAGILGGAISVLDDTSVRIALRVASALALFIAALVAFGALRDPGNGIGRALWSRLAPIGRRLLPVSTFPRAIAFGMVWGWMPCGFVYTVLLLATLAADPWRGGITMAAFGLGTAPALLAASFGSQWLASLPFRTHARRVAGGVLLVSAMITLVAPFVLPHAAWLHAWLPFDCSPPSR